jgi:hypothetical protein
VLEAIDYKAVQSEGYTFQIACKYRAYRAGAELGRPDDWGALPNQNDGPTCAARYRESGACQIQLRGGALARPRTWLGHTETPELPWSASRRSLRREGRHQANGV